MDNLTNKYQLFYKYLFFLPVFLYFFINKEFIGVRLFINESVHTTLLSLIMYFILCTYLVRVLFDKNYFSTNFQIKEFNYFTVLLFLWGIYLLFFGALNGQIVTSAKYFINIIILCLIINYKSKDLISVGNFYYILFSTLLFLLVLQSLIYLLFPEILSESSTVMAVKDNLQRYDSSYRNPLGFGFTRFPSGLVSYGKFEFYRQISYTTEPKYAAVLSITLIIIATIYKKRDFIFYLLLVINFISLLFIHSFAGIGIVIIAFIIFKTNELIKIKSSYLISGFLFFNIILMALITYVLESLSIAKFALARIAGHQSSWYGGGEASTSTLLLGVYRFDVISRIFEWLLFSLFIHISIKYMKNIKSHLTKFSIFLTITSYYVFWMNFLPEPITPILILLISSTFFLLKKENKISNKLIGLN